MTLRQVPLVQGFTIPHYTISGKKIYLAGYSYFLLDSSQLMIGGERASSHPIKFSPPTQAELLELPVLRAIILEGNCGKLMTMLNLRPALPRLLTAESTDGDSQEVHEILFGLLLEMGRSRDLERLYGVVIADTGDDIMDSDELPVYEIITQRESFGCKTGILHERITIRRAATIAVDPNWSYDPIAYPISPSTRIKVRRVRCIEMGQIVGKGSFGYVFYTAGGPQQSSLMKFNIISSEYVREILSQCALRSLDYEELPLEVRPVSSLCAEHVWLRLLSLDPLHAINHNNIMDYTRAYISQCGYEEELLLSVPDQLVLMLRSLLEGIRALRDRFVMHLDISPSNVMWDDVNKKLRLIDHTGTIGDDCFLNLGGITTRICTRTSRAPEYASPETLWQRNESSEALSGYYAIMSHIFSHSLLEIQPYEKESACTNHISKHQSGEGERLDCLRRCHLIAKNLPRYRPSLDWTLSNGSPEQDRAALELGIVGSQGRFEHIKKCVGRYVRLWPCGGNPLDEIWKSRRDDFITLLLSRLKISWTSSSSGGLTTCGGLTLDPIVAPPYTAARCIAIYDALTEIVRNDESSSVIDPVLVKYFNDIIYYPLLVNAILYISLSSAKIILIETSYYSNHPLNVVLRAVLTHTGKLISLFLSPITVYALLLFETPREGSEVSVAAAAAAPPGPANAHRMIRCLYNTKPERRCRPMHSHTIGHIETFFRNYMNLIFTEPIVIGDGEEGWWNLILSGCRRMQHDDAILHQQDRLDYIENTVRLWFKMTSSSRC